MLSNSNLVEFQDLVVYVMGGLRDFVSFLYGLLEGKYIYIGNQLTVNFDLQLELFPNRD